MYAIFSFQDHATMKEKAGKRKTISSDIRIQQSEI
jgi:hypothetical protein